MQLIYQSYHFKSKQKNKITLISRCMYKLLRAILFCFEPERVHYLSMNALRLICSTSFGRKMIQSLFKPKDQPVQVAGLTFRNPVGLAAGFDKNAMYLKELDCIGFGHVEIGTVTPIAQAGNDKPRLFRLTKDKALINRMGFNNNGVDEINNQLIAWRNKNPNTSMIIGGNIGKNKQTPNESAWKDYLICFDALYDVVDYFAVNVSSPNTPGLRALQDIQTLEFILQKLTDARKMKSVRKPVFLKIAPDMDDTDALAISTLLVKLHIDGMIIANTTINRSQLNTSDKMLQQIGAGGLSGKPVKERAHQLLKLIAQHKHEKIALMGSGGIFTQTDAKERFAAGASLVQVWTGFVYEGPSILKNILK